MAIRRRKGESLHDWFVNRKTRRILGHARSMASTREGSIERRGG